MILLRGGRRILPGDIKGEATMARIESTIAVNKGLFHSPLSCAAFASCGLAGGVRGSESGLDWGSFEGSITLEIRLRLTPHQGSLPLHVPHHGGLCLLWLAVAFRRTSW